MAEEIGGEIVVRLDEDLKDLAPGYLQRRRVELPLLQKALAGGDFETLRRAGHELKGTGGGYGFDRLSELGRELELAARQGDSAAAGRVLAGLGTYLGRVRVG